MRRVGRGEDCLCSTKEAMEENSNTFRKGKGVLLHSVV
jgi:hypothetical protein